MTENKKSLKSDAIKRSYTGVIYLIRSKITGKMYIGQTCRSFNTRWRQHCNESFNENSKSYNHHFHKAIRLYGIDNWDYKILKIFSCSSKELLKKQLNISEVEYITLYDTFKNGYNSTLGGEGTIGKDPWNKGKKGVQQYNEETRKKMSASRSGEKNGMYGRHRTEEEKENLRKRWSKPVNQLDLDGNFIKRWNSCKEAQQSGYKNINSVLYGKNKQCKGFKWEWAQK